MSNLIKKYIKLGILPEKIVETTSPAICVWSLSKKCLVWRNGNGKHTIYELIPDGNGNYRISIENNIMVSLEMRAEINVDKINNSEGIIVSDTTYGKPYFRFAYIPTDFH